MAYISLFNPKEFSMQKQIKKIVIFFLSQHLSDLKGKYEKKLI